MPELLKTQILYLCPFYSFIPLHGRLKGKYKDDFKNATHIKPLRLIKHMNAQYWYVELNNDATECFYEYRHAGKDYCRKIIIRFWLVKFSSIIRSHGRYYLVMTIGIDKAFEHQNPYTPFGMSVICTSQDILQLKTAFYGGENHGMYYYDCCKKRNIHDLLDGLIEKITGKNPNGKYGRHYLVDVCGVDIGQNQCIVGRDDLKDLFSKAYYNNNKSPFEETIEDYKKLVYGIIFGNENSSVIPNDTLKKVLDNSFSNNYSERLFAGNKTEVFLHTHHPYEWEPDKENWKKELKDDPLKDQIVFDVFLVMEAKLKLKHIERTLEEGHPSNIKDALASMSRYLSANPYHLGEYGMRYKMLYENMGVTSLFESLKEQGGFHSDSKEIDMNELLNTKLYALTGVTVLIGFLNLFVSVLCCNNSNNQTDMYNNVLDCTGFLDNCLAVIGVLGCLIMAACIVIMTILHYKSYKKLKDVEDTIKKLDY